MRRNLDAMTPSTAPVWGFAMHHGDRLRIARDRRGLSQEQLAELSAVSRASIANYEAGKPMRRLQGRALAMALGVSYDWLATGEEAPSGDDGNEVRPERFELPTFWLGAERHLTVVPPLDDTGDRGREAKAA